MEKNRTIQIDKSKNYYTIKIIIIMRNFRIFIFLAFAAISSMFIYSCVKQQDHQDSKSDVITELRAGNSCLESNLPPNTGSCASGVFTELITLPMYPGCTFHVRVNYYNCTTLGFGGQTFFLGDFEIFDHDCAQYNIDAQNPTAAWELQFNSQVWGATTNSLLNTLIPLTTSTIVFEYIVAACTRTCYVESEPNPKGMTAIIPITTACSSDCCTRSTRYTRTLTGWEASNTTLSSPPMGCPQDNNPPCQGGTISSTPCSGGCAVLLGF